MTDFKTPLVWLLALALAAALAGLGAKQVQLSELRVKHADQLVKVERQAAERAEASASAAIQIAQDQAGHAATQQEIVHDFTKPDPQLAAALADGRDLARRLRDTSAQLAAARAAPDADPAACRDQGDQHAAVVELLREAGRLSAESVDLAVEGRQALARRDREVAALMRLVGADRRLFGEAGGVRFGQPTTGFPELAQPVE